VIIWEIAEGPRGEEGPGPTPAIGMEALRTTQLSNSPLLELDHVRGSAKEM
jgi:hypothetical protein